MTDRILAMCARVLGATNQNLVNRDAAACVADVATLALMQRDALKHLDAAYPERSDDASDPSCQAASKWGAR